MGLGCGGSLMKYLLFIFNFIFFVCGAVILGVGIWVQVDPSVTDYVGLAVNMDDSTYKAAVILLICVGAFILLVGFLGCCGACQESSCMLCLFAGLMTIIVLLQVVAAILAVVFKSEINDELKGSLADQAKNQVSNSTEDVITRSFNRMQIDFKCCGSNGVGDYGDDSLIYNVTGYLVPQSCCTELTSDDPKNPVAKNYPQCSKAAEDENEKYVHVEGCYNAFVDWIKDHAAIVIGTGFGLAVIEILGIIFACCVRSKISDSNYS